MAATERPYGHSLLPPATSAWVSALFVASAVGVIYACVVMYRHRATTFVKRKSWPLFMVSAAGILLVYISQVVYLWLYWEAVRGSGVAWWTGQVCQAGSRARWCLPPTRPHVRSDPCHSRGCGACSQPLWFNYAEPVLVSRPAPPP